MSLTSLLSRRPRFLSSSPKSKSKSSSPTPPPAMSTAQAPVLAEYRRLGKAGIRVSVPILGGMGIGNPVWNPISQPEEKAFPLLKAAWDSGVTTWDLANMYSNGECESIAGKFIKENNLPRNQITLITKIRFLVHHEPSTVTSFFLPAKEDERTYNNQSGLSRVAIFNQVEASLKRLQTDYIDILLIHMADLETPFEETMCALNDLVRAGKVHYIGASNVKTWEFIEMNNVAQANGWTQFSCVQMEHSLLYRVEERDLFAYCNYKGIGIMAYSPLMDGHLARDPGTETDRSKFVKGGPFDKAVTDLDMVIIERVKELSKKHNWTMAQVALAWSVAKVASPVIGANTPERLREAIISGKSLTQEEIAYLEQPYTHKSQRW